MTQNSLTIGGSDEAYVTSEEIANTLHLHRDTPTNWARAYHDLPRLVLPNGALRFRPSEFEAWLKKFRKEVA
jgi:Helix-turn-helix domain